MTLYANVAGLTVFFSTFNAGFAAASLVSSIFDEHGTIGICTVL